MIKLAALLNANSSNYSPRLLRGISQRVVNFNKDMNGEKGIDFDMLGLCRPTYDKFSINRDVREIAEMEPENLLLGGGDGSALFYLNELSKVYGENKFPNIIYLPIGRENKLSHELDIHKKPVKLLDDIIKDLKNGEAEYEKISLIEASLDEEKNVPTFDFGFGMATNIVVHYYGMDPRMVKKDDHFRNMAYPKRKADSFKIFAKVFFNAFRYWSESAKKYFGETLVDIKIDGESYGKKQWLGGLISTNKHVWRGFKPMYRAREDPEKMHLMITSLPPFLLALKLPTLYKGGPLGGNTIDEIAKNVELTFEKPTIVQMAGELSVAEKVDLKVGRRINFVKPQKKRRKKGKQQ